MTIHHRNFVRIPGAQRSESHVQKGAERALKILENDDYNGRAGWTHSMTGQP